MTALIASLTRGGAAGRLRDGITIFGAGIVALAVGRFGASPETFRIAATTSLALLVVGLWATRPRALLFLLVGWLPLLGLVRRLVSERVAPLEGHDPLLLVGALGLILLAATSIERGALRSRTPLSKAVMFLTILVAFGAVNPLQGSPIAGLSALLFFVPIVAFWIGRVLVDDNTLRQLLLLTGALAIPAALYGLAQLFIGFPSWDETWLTTRASGYLALQVGGVIRPFASFSSAQEFAIYLALGIVLLATLGPRKTVRPLGIATIALLAVALFYESSRTIVFFLVGTAVLMLCANRRVPLHLAAVGALIAITLFPFAASRASSYGDSSQGGAGSLVSHQLSGLANPTGGDSTAPGHATLIVDGLLSAGTNPLGHGISVVTIAADSSRATVGGTEADPSNAAVALGLPGLVAYLLIVVYGFRNTYSLATSRSDALAVATLGVLGVTFLQWLNGGLYSVAFLPWLVLGWVDARTTETEARQVEE